MTNNTNKNRNNRLITVTIVGFAILGGLTILGCFVSFFCLRYDVPFRLTGHLEKGIDATDRHFALAPDGTKLVYVSWKTGQEPLYELLIGSKISKRLTFTNDYESSPCFSPDGKWLFYCRETNKCGHIWRMACDGSETKQLTFGGNYDTNPMYAGAGEQLWFQRTPLGTSDGHYDMYSMTVAGKDIQPLDPSSLQVDDVVFCGQNNSRYFTQAGEIWQRAANATESHLLAGGHYLAISPKGDQIAFVSSQNAHEIRLMRPDGSKQHMLYQSKSYVPCVVFGSDGTHVVFVEENPEGIAVASIALDGSGYRQIWNP